MRRGIAEANLQLLFAATYLASCAQLKRVVAGRISDPTTNHCGGVPMLFARLAAAGSVLFGGFAYAAEITIPLQFEPVNSGSDEILAAHFDLGLAFERLDFVTVSVTLPDGYVHLRSCTADRCDFSRLLFDVVDFNSTGSYFPTGGPVDHGAWQVGAFTDNMWVRIVGARVMAPGYYYEYSPGKYASIGPIIATDRNIVWPDSLYAGRGTAVLAVEDATGDWSVDPRGLFSRHRLRLPTSRISNATLTVTGTLVPEPSSFAMALAMLSVFGGRASLTRRREVAKDLKLEPLRLRAFA